MGVDNTGDDLENINDIEKVLRRLGISIRTSTMEFRALDEVLGEIADKWMEYSSVERNAIATAFAGTRQRESFLILLSNMDKARELTKVAAESQGMAELKYQAYMESSEAATKRLQNAWEGLTNSFRTSNFLAGIKNAIAWIVENLDKVASTLGNILISAKTMRSISAIQMLSKTTNKSFMGTAFSSIGKKAKAGWGKVFDYTTGGGLEAYLPRYSNYLQDLVRMVGAISRQKPTSIPSGQVASGATGGSIQVFDAPKGQAAQGPDGNWYYINKDNTISKRKVNKTDAAKLNQQKATLDNKQSQQKIAAKGGTLGQRIGRGITTGVVSGMVQGFSTYGTLKNRDGELASQETRIKMGIASGLSTAVATGVISALPYVGPVLGPTLGPLLGQAFNLWLAPALGNILDQQAISRRERSKEAEKSYSAIKAIQNDTNTLKELSTEGTLSFDQYQKAKTSVNNMITQLYGNTKAGRILLNQYDPNNPANENLSDLEVIDRIKLLFNNYLSGDTSVLTQWEKALYQAEVETFKASKENELYTNKEVLNNAYVKHAYGGGIKTALRDFMKLNPTLFDEDALREGKLYFKGTTNERLDTERKLLQYLGDQGYDTTAFYKQLQKNIADLSGAVNNIDSTVGEINEKQVAASVIDKGIGDLTTAQIKRMGIDEIAQKILEDVNEKGGFYEGNGDIQYRYQWTGSLESLGGVAKDYISDYIKNNATLYGILTGQSYTLGEVSKGALTGKKADDYKLSFARQLNITIEELDANLEKYSSFSLGDIMKGYEDVKSALENLDSLFNSIVSSTGMTADNFETILSKFPSLIGEANDIGSLVAAIFNQTDTYIDIQRKNLIEDLGSNTSFFTEWKLSLSEDVRELMKDTALDNADSGASFWKAYLTLSENDKKTFAEVAESFKKQFNSVTADVSIDTAILDKYRSYISKVYEMQIKNLQDQKSALEKINDQREYENKLVEARLKLENAQNEKQMVYREGVGFVYEADQEAIQEAQKELDKLENEKVVSSLDVIITEMQSQKDWLVQLPERMEFQKLTEAFGEKSPLAKILGTKDSGIWGSVNTLIEMYQKTHKFSSQGFTAEQEAILKGEKADTVAYLQQYNNEYEAYERINEALNQYRAGNLSQADLSEAIAKEATNKNNSVNVRTYAKNLWNSLENANYNVPTIMEAVHNTQAQAQTAFTNANTAANRMQNEFKVTNEMTRKYSSHTKDAEGNWVLNNVFDKLGTDRSLNGRTLLGANEKDWAREKAKSEIIDAFANGPGKYMRFSANGQDWLLQTVDKNQSWTSNYRDVLWDFFSNQKYYVDVPALKEVFGDEAGEAIGKPHYRDRDANSNAGGAVDFYRTFYENKDVFDNLSTAQQQYLRSLYKNITPGTSFEEASGLGSIQLRDRIGYWDLMKLIDNIFADSSIVPVATDVSQLSKEANARGSLYTRAGLSAISELGPELFVTPGLSGTALIPEGSKVLPAEATKGLWQFGSFAAEFIKPLRSLMSGFGTNNSTVFGADESTNINTLNITLRADKDFDADRFIQQLKLLQAISKNNA